MITAEQTIVEQLDIDTQRELVAQVREVLQISRLVRPLSRGGKPMSVRVSAAGELGWVGDANGYRYDRSDSSGRPWPFMPPLWREIADRVAGEHPWDSAIINWYSSVASLGWHRDQSEHDTTLPIVTISLGDAASWAIRADEHSPISRCTLESGAVTLLAGPTRSYLHTIERIVSCPMNSPLDTAGRVSITARVAGPHGIRQDARLFGSR